MSTIQALPASYREAACAIEASSNPHCWSKTQLSDSLNNCEHQGLFINNKLIAFVLYSCIADEAEIIHLVCAHQHQGRGYAKQLLQHLIQTLKQRSAAQLFLEVRTDNHTAINLYQHLGFDTVGMRKNYYADGTDAILKKLMLSAIKD